jgi:hypothetical protein
MKIARQLRFCLALATLACAAWSPALFGQAPPPIQTVTPEAKNIPTLKIRSGPLVAAVEELSRTLEASHLPEMNVIYAQEARTILVPDLVLRNVSGPDALRLITVSAGCEMDVIPGSDGSVIGYRVFSSAQGAQQGLGQGGPFAPGAIVDTPSSPPGVGQAPGFPGSVTLSPGSPSQPVLGNPQPLVMGFPGMATAGTNNVRVYSLGGITNTTKFDDVEATLRDVLKADGVSSDAAKLAFHQRTNVLVVAADSRVHELVTQFLEALQKNVAAAAAEEKRNGVDRRELVDAIHRLQIEQDQREKVTKQLSETEATLRDAQRELDRLKATGSKPQ